MKVKKTRSPKASRRTAWNWNPVFVGLQAFLVLSALIAITQCSPLAPSTDISGGAVKANAQANKGTVSGGEEAARQLLAKDLERKSVTILTYTTKNRNKSEYPKKHSTPIITITLTKDDVKALADGRPLTLEILPRLRAKGYVDEKVMEDFVKLREARSREIWMFVSASEKSQWVGFSSTKGYFSINQVEGILVIQEPSTKNFVDVLRMGPEQVDVEIHAGN